MTAYPPRHKNPHRPYSRKRKYGASVTTSLGTMGSPDGLKWAAVRETVNFVLDYGDEWLGIARDQAFEKLYRHHDVLWTGRREMGTLIHLINEAWSYGEEVDIDELVSYVAEQRMVEDESKRRPVRIWLGREQYVAKEAEGYVDGLEQFWIDFEPETIGTEEIVLHEDKGSHGYIGTRDWTAKLRGLDGVTLIDIKTTAKQFDPSKPDDGLYWDKFRLQLAAYRAAERIVRMDDKGEIVDSWPAYPIARCGVLHLRGDGKYQFFEVQAGGDELAHFYRQIDMHKWVTSGCNKPGPVDHTIYKATEAAA